MAVFPDTIVHIPGENIMWADLLSRWGAPTLESKEVSKLALLQAFVYTAEEERFSWPSKEHIRLVQENLRDEGMATKHTNHEGLFCNDKGMILIPQDLFELLLCILVIAHCERGGHRGRDATHQNAAAYFYWESLRKDIAVFVNSFPQFMVTRGGLRVPQTVAHAIYVEKQKKVIHFDILFMEKIWTRLPYIMLIKNDLSSFVLLYTVSDADS